MGGMRVLLLWFGLLGSVFGEAGKPNVVLILADDMGWGDAGCYNAESKIATPHLDALAAGGMRFVDVHTPSSVCTPTRYTLLTGRYCWRTRLTSSVLDGFSPPLIEEGRVNLASLLKAKGYATACIGKWHLGMQWTKKDGTLEMEDRGEGGFRAGDDIDFGAEITGGPTAIGFDSFFGISASLDMPPYCWIENGRCVPAPDGAIETAKDTIFLNQSGGAAHSAFTLEGVLPRLKERAVDWIDGQVKADAEEPFFLYLPLNSPHLPVVPSAAFAGKSAVGHYGDFVMETDDFVGAVLDALERGGVLENTLVLFTSDNGGLWHGWEAVEEDDVAHYKPTPRAEYTAEFGHRSNAHLRGTKADIWEGGHRVPLIVHWPEVVEAGAVSAAQVELTDVLATVVDCLGEELGEETGPDSFSFLPVLKGEAETSARPVMVHHSLRGVFAIRQGDWKYVEARGSGGFSTPRQLGSHPRKREGQLYNLGEDVSETMNRWFEEPERVKEMGGMLERVRGSEGLREFSN